MSLLSFIQLRPKLLGANGPAFLFAKDDAGTNELGCVVWSYGNLAVSVAVLGRSVLGRPKSNKYFKSATVNLLSFFDAALKLCYKSN